jgi:hypothetical protein
MHAVNNGPAWDFFNGEEPQAWSWDGLLQKSLMMPFLPYFGSYVCTIKSRRENVFFLVWSWITREQ